MRPGEQALGRRRPGEGARDDERLRDLQPMLRRLYQETALEKMPPSLQELLRKLE